MAKDIDIMLISRKNWHLIYNELCEIYMSVFKWNNLPETIDSRYMEKYLLLSSQVAFYYEDYISNYVCLSSATVGKEDVYGNPVNSRVYGVNGFSRPLPADSHVVIWDNMTRSSPTLRLMQFAKRIYDMERTIDINIAQQKTPRIIKCTKETELSVKTLLKDVDNYAEKVVVIDGFNENANVEVCLAPAPFVADIIRIQKRQLWNEVLSFIGIENNSSEKSERLLADEVTVSNALAVVKRNSRMESRQRAIDQINRKWNLNIEIEVNQTSMAGSVLESFDMREAMKSE